MFFQQQGNRKGSKDFSRLAGRQRECDGVQDANSDPGVMVLIIFVPVPICGSEGGHDECLRALPNDAFHRTQRSFQTCKKINPSSRFRGLWDCTARCGRSASSWQHKSWPSLYPKLRTYPFPHPCKAAFVRRRVAKYGVHKVHAIAVSRAFLGATVERRRSQEQKSSVLSVVLVQWWPRRQVAARVQNVATAAAAALQIGDKAASKVSGWLAVML
ncbi:hypothetical protein F5I97DRAFT_2074611 [Phlebopus sp. FC_14]|nr:hypothetical protein F5I97DRAFT_2074611 [Phlebopus sp. FC_14]